MDMRKKQTVTCGIALSVIAWLGTMALAAAAYGAAPAEEYEIGGPLAGLKLPLFKTQHGEEPGYPGCIPELMAKGKEVRDMGNVYREYGPQGQPPQLELYPGSIENWRAYWFKYCPVRSMFDRQSQIKNWVAPNIPGATAASVEEYAAPVYWVPRHAPPVNTGYKNRPVPVIRCKVGVPVFRLDLGELDVGLYALRVIAAVPTEQLRSFRQPLYLNARINDGLQGEVSNHRIRLGYVDEFYSIAEVYFHATSRRNYQAELWVGEGSKVDMLVHNISLDDVLAGHTRGMVKTQRTLAAPPPAITGTPLPREQRLERDATIWENFPPPNAQGANLGTGGDEHVFRPNVQEGVADKTNTEIAAEFGAWVRPGPLTDPKTRGIFLVNQKLNLRYTMADLAAHQPLPDPYPYKDDGAGLYFPDPQDPGKGRVFAPIANEVSGRIREYYNLVTSNTDRYLKTGDANAARDAAVALARYAYAFPTIDTANFLLCVVRDPGPYGREYRCRRRETTAFYLPHYPMYVDPIMYKYDALYDYIKSDKDLAASIGRYVPWVKTPEDVIALIDTYFVQTVAKRIMRYHYATDPMDLGNLAAAVGKSPIVEPWIDWLFARTFVYPLPVAGIQDLMITGCERDGCEYIGSTYYAQGEGAERVAASVQMLKKLSLLPPQYDLTNASLYPKPVAQCYWRIKNVVAGGDFLRIGDVCGPDKVPGHTLRDLGFARHGWQWTGDPRFAFIVKHFSKRDGETDEEWQRIEQAAAQVKRAPWLDNRSRVMPMWAGVLESGLEHDDMRFRRAAYVRLGFGVGHAHNDSMDLQVVMHGLPATIDGGQRGGYSRPGDASTRVHNVVEVNGRGFQGYSWARTLADTPGARCLHVDSEPPTDTRLFRRQVMLIDVHEGRGSAPIEPRRQMPISELPKGVTLPDSYVVDFFRIGGGKIHTYCFHGPVDDEFTWNVPDSAPPKEGSQAAQYLGAFVLPEKKLAGTAPDVLEVTWRQHRDQRFGSEQSMLGRNYSADLPRHYTRLHLLGVGGDLAMRANLDCFQWKYDFSCLMVQRQAPAEAMDSVYAAIIEPYRGQPFITGRRLLPVAGNDEDALRAVAIEVKTANGHTDLCFADGRPEKVRKVRTQDAECTIAGEFGYYSMDTDGLRQATLVGGTILDTPRVRLQLAQGERTGKVTKVDYAARALWIDQIWPAVATQPFEVGVPGHWTTYTATRLQPEQGGTKITVDNGADYYRSRIESIDPQTGTVKCTLGLTMTQRPGIDKHWVASNDDQSHFWRADYIDTKTFRLSGAPVTAEAFGKANVLRLWEYGVGDSVRQSTFASLRRIEPGLFELTANADCIIAIPTQGIEVSSDKAQWRPVTAERVRNMLQAKIAAADLSPEGQLYVRTR